MYVPENTSANITPDTTKVSSVTGIEIVYYKGYPYMRHGIIDTNGVSIKITPYVGTSESKIQETTKMINDFYSNSFDF